MRPARKPISRYGRNKITADTPQLEQAQTLLNSRQTLFIFWCLVSLFLLNWLRKGGDYEWQSQAGYFLIGVSALMPIRLWCTGKAPGLPIFPAFAGFQFLAFGMPLLSEHPGITIHFPESHLSAALIIALSLGAGTLGWLMVGDRITPPPLKCLQLAKLNGDRVLIVSILLNFLFSANTVLEWMPIPGGIFSLMRGIIGGVSTLAIFVLGQHLGQGKLSKGLKVSYLVLIISLFFIQTTTLLLVNAITVAVLAIGGYTLGSRRPPWLALAALVFTVSFLHIGKSPVREAYWGENRESTIHSLGDMVGLFSFWIQSSNEALIEDREARMEEERKSSTFDRISLMHLLLLQKDILDKGYPHLDGETYWIIPGLLVPRFINPNKAWSQEGTTLLNIHFGLQTRESSMVTTIGWGLLNEAYANFGLFGALGVCFLIGAFTGWVSRLSQGLPFLSFRSLAGILLLSSTFQTEFSLSVMVTSLFQAFIGLLAFSFFFMKQLPTGELIRFIEIVPKKKKERVKLTT